MLCLHTHVMNYALNNFRNIEIIFIIYIIVLEENIA